MKSGLTGISFTVKEAYIEEGDAIINGIRLRRFQEELFNSLGKYRRILLRAPTGSGKTFTLILAAIKSRLEAQYYPVVGIYPSKALVYDQARSICETLRKMGLRQYENRFIGDIVINGENKGSTELNIYVVTSESRRGIVTAEDDCWQGDIPSDYPPSVIPIVLTVPEYPYMIITAMNRQYTASRIIEAALKYDFDDAVRVLGGLRSEVRELYNDFARAFNGYWFIDEFHLYSGLARKSMLALIEMFEKYNSVIKSNKSVVFSSATPVPISVDKAIEVKTVDKGSRIRKATHVVFHLSTHNPQEELVNYVQEGGEVRTAVILDRIYYIAELCRRVKDAAVVWGLDIAYGNCRKVEKGLDREKFIIGNQAMSFGIDIDLDKGFIHAHDAETLIQRFGRFGRHGNGAAEVHVFIEAGAKAIHELSSVKGKDVSYEEFLDLIRKIYRERIYDKLDEIFFSRIRYDVMIRVFALTYAVSQGEHVYSLARQWYPSNEALINGRPIHEILRPSYDEYFYVFAYRPGGLRGRWCEGGEDELFSMLRNFAYDHYNHCFTKNPLKEMPAIIPSERKIGSVKCDFMTFNDFSRSLSPRLILQRQGMSVPMSRMREFENSYVVMLTRECTDWGSDFPEMARLVSTYENAIPIYRDEQLTTVIGLALFI